MKLHLGCGKLYLNNYINVDLLSEIADLKLDCRDLSVINNDKIDEIYISHTLEHFKRHELLKVLLEWNRVLKNEGILRICVPDFEKVVARYIKNGDLSEILGLVNGGQIDDLDIHYTVFDITTLTEILEICGFKDVNRYDTFNFLNEDQDDYSKCHLPHMDFTDGELMSLNILCIKEKNVLYSELNLSDKIKKFVKFS
jgi:predicted SAM-dependent methyltransferase